MPNKKIEMLGKRFGRLTVIEEVKERKHRGVCWICRCDCGNTTTVAGSSLRRSYTQSCGCLRSESVTAAQTKHKKHKTRLYKVWAGIKSRCFYQKNSRYASYGGRGITVCDEWLNDFQAFYDWAMTHGYNPDAKRGECTIDRIDVNGNYEPSNCRWVDMKVQRLNQRSNTTECA